MKKLKMSFVLIAMMVSFNSCQKEEAPQAFDEISLSQQETLTEEALAEIDVLVDEALDLNFVLLKSAHTETSFLGDCQVVTIDRKASPQVMIIDFGTGCVGKDGKTRSGKIIVTSTAFNVFPSVRNKTFENFVVEGRKIEGSVTKTISKDQENNIRTAQLQEDVTITFADKEGTAKRVANMTRQYMRNTLANPADNQVVSWGTVEFTRISGVKVTKTIAAENPLVYKASCRRIVSGVVSFTSSDNKSWSIDYGTGECDNIATLTNGDKTREIKIR